MDGLDHDVHPRSPESTSLIKQIELQTKKTVTVQTSPTTSKLSKCHQQHQSPLFRLPAELREIIFELATRPYYAPGSYLDEQDIHYRPDQEGRWTVSVGLPQSCRRLWLETNHLPMQQARLYLYFPCSPWDVDFEDWVARLTPNNRPLLRHARVFLHRQSMLAEARAADAASLLLSSKGLCPEVLTLTQRNVDARRWDSAHRHGQDFAPRLGIVLAYPASPRVLEIRFELEMLITREDRTGRETYPLSRAEEMLGFAITELRESSARVERLDELGNAVCWVMLPEKETPRDRTWFGARNLGGKELSHFGDVDKLEYKIKTLVWQVRPADEVGQPLGCNEAQNVPAAASRTELQDEPDSAAVEKRKECEARWAREGSLLRFL